MDNFDIQDATTRPHAPTDPDALWWVLAQDAVYGPYEARQMRMFRAEGRITPRSRVASDPKGPWAPAAESAIFADGPAESIASQDANILIWGDIPSGAGEGFEALLQGLGSVARLGQGVWIIRTAQTPASLRALLTAQLSQGDRLIVADATRDQLAWANMGMDDETAIRRVWKGA